jgi:phosphorylcholine metabolism protein LicD
MDELRYLSDSGKKKYLKKINKFYNYDDNILQIMQKKTIYEHKYIDSVEKIDNNMKKKIYDLTNRTAKFLEKYNIEYWLDGGTLLGAMRNHKIIDWDDDADIAIPYNSYIKLENLIKTFESYVVTEKNKEKIYYIDHKYNIKFKISQGNPKKSIYKNISLMINSSLLEDNSVIVDLIVYIKKNNKYIPNTSSWENTFVYNIDDIYPLKQIKFGNHKYYIVNNPINYLNNGYWFWKHLGVASHSHYKNLINTRNTTNYFLLKKTFV